MKKIMNWKLMMKMKMLKTITDFLKKYFFIQLCSTPKKYNKYFIFIMLRIHNRAFGLEKIVLKILPVEYHKLNSYS